MSLYLGENLISGISTTIDKSERIGQIISSTIPLTDAGLHLLDGALISGSGSYSAFVDYIDSIYDASANYFTDETTWQNAVAQYGVCGKFVYDSVNNTVRLPKITGIIEGITDLTALGDLVEAGLPNITGSVKSSNGLVASQSSEFTQNSGALTFGDFASTSITRNATGNFPKSMTLDASQSSSIYGNSTTVQPQTIKILYYIVIATSTKTEIQIDIDEIATDLNGKADVDLTNINSSCKPIDGQWVSSPLQLSTSTAIGSYTIDLSSYLPNDGYYYEVKFLLYGYSNSSAETYYYIANDVLAYVGRSIGYTNSSSRSLSVIFDYPISTQRSITFEIGTTAANTCTLHAFGYRRIGTNQ